MRQITNGFPDTYLLRPAQPRSADIPPRPRPGAPCQFVLRDRHWNHLVSWQPCSYLNLLRVSSATCRDKRANISALT